MNTVHTETAPAALGPYSQAMIVDGWVYTSGQVGIDPTTGEMVPGGFEAQAQQVLKNLDAVLSRRRCRLRRRRQDHHLRPRSERLRTAQQTVRPGYGRAPSGSLHRRSGALARGCAGGDRHGGSFDLILRRLPNEQSAHGIIARLSMRTYGAELHILRPCAERGLSLP